MSRSSLTVSFTHGTAVALCAAIFAGCTFQSAQPKVVAPTPALIQEFLTRSGLTIPHSAQPTDWYEERGMDDTLSLRLRVPVSDLEAFLSQPLLKGLKLSAFDPSITHGFQVFGPTPATYRAGQQRLPNARFVNVLIDDGDPQTANVYLMWGET